MKRIFSIILAVALMFGFTATIVVGEETNSAGTGTLSGTLLYPEYEGGGVAPRVEIMLFQQYSGFSNRYYAISDDNGEYIFKDIPPGENYALELKVVSNKTGNVTNMGKGGITITSGETTTADIYLFVIHIDAGEHPCGVGRTPEPIIEEPKVEKVKATEYESSGEVYRYMGGYFDDGKFISAEMSYASNKDETIKSYIALYTADGALHSIRSTEHEVTANKRFTLTTDSIEIPENQEVMYIKVFVWGEDGTPRGERILYRNKSLFPFRESPGDLPVI